MSDRIEELEAKLAKAVEALDIAQASLSIMAWGKSFTRFDDVKWEMVKLALDVTHTTLAELKGEDRG